MTRGIVANLWLIPAAPLAVSLIILSLANSRRKSAARLFPMPVLELQQVAPIA